MNTASPRPRRRASLLGASPLESVKSAHVIVVLQARRQVHRHRLFDAFEAARVRAIEGDASQVAHRGSHVVGDDQLAPFGGLGDAGRQVHDTSDDVVARHQHRAAVDAGPQSQGRCLAQLEAGEHGRLRRREGEHEAVAEPLEHASPAAAHDRPRLPVVADQQPAGSVVALGLGVGGEVLEVGEGDRELDRQAARLALLVGCREHGDRGDGQRSDLLTMRRPVGTARRGSPRGQRRGLVLRRDRSRPRCGTEPPPR